MSSTRSSASSAGHSPGGFVLPGCPGLLIFGITLMLFSLVEMQLWPVPGPRFRWLLLVGGTLMLLAGLGDLRHRNGFGAILNLAFGFFWLSLSAFVYIPHGPGRSENPALLASYVIMWGMFSCLLFLASLRQSKLLRAALGFLAVYQFALGAALLHGHAWLQLAAGTFGLSCGGLLLILGMLRLGQHFRSRKTRFSRDKLDSDAVDGLINQTGAGFGDES